MAHKYDCWFCKCGRIQIMDMDLYDWLAKKHENRYIVRICTNCGANHRVWLTENFDNGFDINGAPVNPNGSRSIIDTTEDDEYKFIFDPGIKIPMKSGGYANYRYHNGYADTDYMMRIMNTISIENANRKNPDCVTVDTQRLIREVNDDDILQSISGYVVGIDWSGTKYDYKERVKNNE